MARHLDIPELAAFQVLDRMQGYKLNPPPNYDAEYFEAMAKIDQDMCSVPDNPMEPEQYKVVHDSISGISIQPVICEHRPSVLIEVPDLIQHREGAD